MESGKKKNQKLIQEEEMDLEGPLQSTQLEESSKNIDNYEFEEEMKLKTAVNESFKLNATVERFLAERRRSASDNIDDINTEEVDDLPPDQDHNYLAEDDDIQDGDNNIELLRAKKCLLNLNLRRRT